MSLPRNNLAEQMALLQKKNLKSMLKRKRQSDPILSQSKRPSLGLNASSSSLPSSLSPASSSSFKLSSSNKPRTQTTLSGDKFKLSSKPGPKVPTKSAVINLSDDEKQPRSAIFDDDDDSDFEPVKPSQAKVKKPTPPKPTKRSIFDSLSPVKKSNTSSLIFGIDEEEPPPPPPPPPRPRPSSPPPPPPPPKPDSSKDNFNICADDLFGEDESFSKKSIPLDIKKESSTDMTSRKESLFDTDKDYDLFGESISKTPVKSEKSFAETIKEFGLLEKNETTPQKPAPNPIQPSDTSKPLPLSRNSSINQQSSSSLKLRSPDRSVMVKVQPSKGVKKNIESSELFDIKESSKG